MVHHLLSAIGYQPSAIGYQPSASRAISPFPFPRCNEETGPRGSDENTAGESIEVGPADESEPVTRINEEEVMLTTQEAMEFLRVSQATIYRMIKRRSQSPQSRQEVGLLQEGSERVREEGWQLA